jgi:hypothetical protein
MLSLLTPFDLVSWMKGEGVKKKRPALAERQTKDAIFSDVRTQIYEFESKK